MSLTRRPHLVLPPDERHPVYPLPPDYADAQTFEYREEAQTAAGRLNAAGWRAYPQYMAAHDLWFVMARRKTNPEQRLLRTDGVPRAIPYR